MSEYAEYGLAAIVVLGAFELVKWTLRRNGKFVCPVLGQPERISALNQRVIELHDWHAPDASGQQTWKNPLMVDAIGKLTHSIEKQTEFLRQVADGIKDLKATIDAG